MFSNFLRLFLSLDNQISSVQRQLNLYGFKCISRGEFKRSFFHPKFRRGDWETVRKLTRYIPLKKASDKSDDSPPSPEPVLDSKPAAEDRTVPQPVMYPPYFYPLAPPGNMGGAASAMQFMHSGHPTQHMLAPHPHAANMGMWQDGWSHQGPQFAYTTMPIHQQQHAYQQAHHHHHHAASSMPVQTATTDSKPQSELTNRLGFKWPAGTEEASGTATPSTEGVDVHTTKPTAAAHHDASQPLTSVSQNNVVTVNADYDFMVEFGMFDSLHLPELINSAMNAHSSAPQAGAHALAAVPVRDQATSAPSAAAAAPIAVTKESRDVGCNTLLTFSKLHDALVVLHPELELK